MAPRETENNACAKFGLTNKEHYGMLWYFWSGQLHNKRSNLLPDMCVGPVVNCRRNYHQPAHKIYYPSHHSQYPETGKSVDQSIEGKLTSPTKTMRLDSALL